MTHVVFAGGGTGGHLYPALTLAAALQAERPGIEAHFVGAWRGVEARILPARRVPHTLLPIEPLHRAQFWRNWRQLPAITGTLLGLRRLFRRLRPRLVVGTGGYASGPACAWALLHGVPVALQEQNSYPGLTTRWLSRWAAQVHLGFPEAGQHLHEGKRTNVYALGNPIRPPDVALDRAQARRHFALAENGLTVLVVGGSQGARAVNDALVGALEGVAAGRLDVPAGLQLLWATGPGNFDAIRARLDRHPGLDWVHPVSYIEDMEEALAASDLALSRSGAITTAELLAWGIPSVLVPLPTAAADHQTHNAQSLADAGAAVFLRQAELSPERLWSELTSLAEDEGKRMSMAERARERGDPDAAREIAQRLLTLLDD